MPSDSRQLLAAVSASGRDADFSDAWMHHVERREWGRWPTVRCQNTQQEKQTSELLPPRSGIGPKRPLVPNQPMSPTGGKRSPDQLLF
ncbi:hypothetical protein CO661_29725 [Sinorhizobium fredii]|uniref:Uncharacterized protein n=1 Tax=Rhizobium fredii TaxID=380 RepID=A0A2A6LPY6_RHIFR|nr:hypothetical protein CO661_29725 [Sinorhizobium fredii]